MRDSAGNWFIVKKAKKIFKKKKKKNANKVLLI